MALFWRLFVIAAAALGFAHAAIAADLPKEIRIDWATYNPVSMLLKQKGFLEQALAKDGTTVRWVQTNSSSNALQFLNAGHSLPRSTAIPSNQSTCTHGRNGPRWSPRATVRSLKYRTCAASAWRW